jgi:hypothetical protein
MRTLKRPPRWAFCFVMAPDFLSLRLLEAVVGQLTHRMGFSAMRTHRVVGSHVPETGGRLAEKTLLLDLFQAHAPLAQLFDIFFFDGNQLVLLKRYQAVLGPWLKVFHWLTQIARVAWCASKAN